MDSSLKIINTKEFTEEQKTLFENLLLDELMREANGFMRKNNLKWLAVIKEEQVVCGMVYKIYKKKKLVYLKSLATHDEHRRRGYASLLLAHLRKHVAGIREVAFFCDQDRAAFYKKRGAVLSKKKKFRKKLPDYFVPAQCVTMKFAKIEITKVVANDADDSGDEVELNPAIGA